MTPRLFDFGDGQVPVTATECRQRAPSVNFRFLCAFVLSPKAKQVAFAAMRKPVMDALIGTKQAQFIHQTFAKKELAGQGPQLTVALVKSAAQYAKTAETIQRELNCKWAVVFAACYNREQEIIQ